MGNIRFQVVEQDGQEFVREIHRVVVHHFKLSGLEDPDLCAAEPILNWQKSDAGEFVLKHAVKTPVWQRHLNYDTYSYQYVIIAELEQKHLSEFYLRFGTPKLK
jgi:hypothetical protein